MAGAMEVDFGPVVERLGLHVVFLSVSRHDEVFVRVTLEAYEGLCVPRAHDPDYAEGRTLLSLFVMPDFVREVRALLDDLASTADLTFVCAEPQWLVEVEHALLEG